jgi:hypothetical protein
MRKSWLVQVDNKVPPVSSLVALFSLSVGWMALGQPASGQTLAQAMVGTWAIGGVDRCSSAPYQVSLSNDILIFRDRAGKIVREKIEQASADTLKSRSLETATPSQSSTWAYKKRDANTIQVSNEATGRSFSLFNCNPVPAVAQQQEQSRPQAASDQRETVFWESIRESRNPEEFEAYLQAFPQGTFAPLARSRLRTLQSAQPGTPPTPIPPSAPSIAQVPSAPPATVPPPQGAATPPNPARSGDLVTVTATGVGRDIEAASKSAAENALTQVVGTLVDTERRVSRETRIADGIRSEARSISSRTREYSQGSIRGFEILNSGARGGFTEVTAKVTVKIEDFRAFIAKLAEGEATIAPGLFAGAAIEARNQQSLADILTDRVFLPVLKGEASNFLIGEILGLGAFKEKLIKQLGGEYNIGDLFYGIKSTAQVVNVRSVVKKEFIDNAERTISGLAFASAGLPRTQQGAVSPLSAFVEKNFGSGLSVSWESAGVACVWRAAQNPRAYAFKNLPTRTMVDDRELKQEILSAVNEGAMSRSEYLYRLRDRSPSLEVSLHDEGAVIFQSIISGGDASIGRLISDGTGTIFIGSLAMLGTPEIIPWINLRAPFHCPTVVDEVSFFVIVHVPVEVLLRTRRINFRIAQ